MSFQSLTPDVIEGMGFQAYEEAIWARTMEARAVGVVPNTLHELLLSRITQVGKTSLASRKVGRTTEFAPFKYRTRSRNQQMSYFNVSAGVVHPTAGAGSIPNSAWNLTVTIGPGEFATQYTNLGRYFLPGHFIVVEHKNVSTNVAYTSVHKVISAVDVNATSSTITVSAPFTTAGWTALSSGQKLPYQPTFGAVQILANNVSDYEAFALNAPTNLSEELLIDWFQTTREFRGRNEEYEKGLKNILDGNVNEFLKKFRFLDVTERNKQEMSFWQQTFLNNAFYGARANEFQKNDPTWSDINQLEQVVDPEDSQCLYERKANALGVHTQLVENGRRLDLQGGQLDFDLVVELLQTMRRHRQLDGKPHDTIDLMMDRFTKHSLDTLLTRYLTSEYGVTHTRYVSEGKSLDSTGVVMFEYTVYDLPKQNLRVGLFNHRFFEDRLSAFTTGAGGSVNNRSRGRMMMALDWEDIALGVLETNSVKREYRNEITAQANPIFTSRMKLNTKCFDMRSTTWDVEMGDFNRHLILENFSDACPKLTVSGCNVTAAA